MALVRQPRVEDALEAYFGPLDNIQDGFTEPLDALHEVAHWLVSGRALADMPRDFRRLDFAVARCLSELASVQNADEEYRAVAVQQLAEKPLWSDYEFDYEELLQLLDMLVHPYPGDMDDTLARLEALKQQPEVQALGKTLEAWLRAQAGE